MMNSERRKREEEIDRLMQGTGLSGEADGAFQEEVRKTTAAMVEQETRRIQKTERAESRKRAISPATAGLWLLAVGAGLTFALPIMGGALIVCGIAAIIWATLLKPKKK